MPRVDRVVACACRNERPEVVVVARGDERLQEKLERQVRGHRPVGPRVEFERVLIEIREDVTPAEGGAVDEAGVLGVGQRVENAEGPAAGKLAGQLYGAEDAG